jgi:hypothetical protein
MKFDDNFKSRSREVLALFDEDILKEATTGQASFQKVEIDLSEKPLAGKVLSPQKARRNARRQQLVRQLEFLQKKGISENNLDDLKNLLLDDRETYLATKRIMDDPALNFQSLIELINDYIHGLFTED